MKRYGPVLPCQNCGKEFQAWHRAGQKFCSLNCTFKFSWKTGKVQSPKRKRVNLICEVCSKPFDRTPSYIEGNNSRGYGTRFCSAKCRGRYTISIRYPNSDKTIKPRRHIRRGKKDYCEICGYNKYPQILHMHHKDGNRSNNSEENGQTLCPNCHAIKTWYPYLLVNQ